MIIYSNIATDTCHTLDQRPLPTRAPNSTAPRQRAAIHLYVIFDIRETEKQQSNKQQKTNNKKATQNCIFETKARKKWKFEWDSYYLGGVSRGGLDGSYNNYASARVSRTSRKVNEWNIGYRMEISQTSSTSSSSNSSRSSDSIENRKYLGILWIYNCCQMF